MKTNFQYQSQKGRFTMKTETKKMRLLTLKEAAKLIDGLTEYRVRQLVLQGDIKYGDSRK